MVITAATAGIGLGIAQRLGEEGAKLTICSRKQVCSTVKVLYDGFERLSHGFISSESALHASFIVKSILS